MKKCKSLIKFFIVVVLIIGIVASVYVAISRFVNNKDSISKSTESQAIETKNNLVDNTSEDIKEKSEEDNSVAVNDEIADKYVAENKLPENKLEDIKKESPSEKTDGKNKLIVIDAGHQRKGNSTKEPIAPGSSQTKAKVASGTTGVSTNIPEYQVTLAVSLNLEKELKSRGYEVIMVRRTHDVDISNSERAKIANDAGADAFIRIHCNGIQDSSVKGALTMCQTANNPYCGNLYEQSRLLSERVVDGLCEQTGARNRGVSETDTMSGINWCSVPVTIVEMGFMTNSEEDQLLCDSSYQKKLAIGIADGIDNYFK